MKRGHRELKEFRELREQGGAENKVLVSFRGEGGLREFMEFKELKELKGCQGRI